MDQIIEFHFEKCNLYSIVSHNVCLPIRLLVKTPEEIDALYWPPQPLFVFGAGPDRVPHAPSTYITRFSRANNGFVLLRFVRACVKKKKRLDAHAPVQANGVNHGDILPVNAFLLLNYPFFINLLLTSLFPYINL